MTPIPQYSFLKNPMNRGLDISFLLLMLFTNLLFHSIVLLLLLFGFHDFLFCVKAFKFNLVSFIFAYISFILGGIS